MLEIDVIVEESFDEATSKFVATKSRVNLEHSLASLSKWESIWEEPFLGDKQKTSEQTISYVRQMIVGGEPSPEVFQKLLSNHLPAIVEYIGAAMTATKVSEAKKTPGVKETITSELIYHWMISMNIPAEAQYWHLNRLITLIRVISVKNAPKKKMSLAERRALVQQRREKYGTNG